MRVLFDTNIFVSYLLGPQKSGPIRDIVEAAFLGELTLLVPEEILEELAHRVESKKYLAGRITKQDLQELASLLRQVSEPIPKIKTAIPAVTRDPQDDYLLAYALVGRANYLVTGDNDLLTLQEVEQVEIVTARELLALLKRT